MPAPGTLRPRQGRLRRQSAAIPLPTLWFELGGPIGDMADLPAWRLPNTYPFVRIELRQSYDTDGVAHWAYLNVIPPVDEFVSSVMNVMNVYAASFKPIFDSVGKPFRFALLLAGVDNPDAGLKLTNHPRDLYARTRQRPWMQPGEHLCSRGRHRMRRNGTMLGKGPALGGGLKMQTVESSFFHQYGREEVLGFFSQALPALATALEDAGFPMPELCLTTFEGNAKDPAYSYPIYEYVEWWRASSSWRWFSDLERDLPLRPPLQTHVMDGGVTLTQWFADHQTDLRHNPLPKHNPAYFVAHPNEDDLRQRAIAANVSTYIASLNYAVYQPAKAAFGSGVRCANWAYGCDGRVYPAEHRPTLLRYAMNGVYGMDVQPLSNYFNDPFWKDEQFPVGDPDPRWNLWPNWSPRFQNTPADDETRVTRWYSETFSSVNRSAAFSSNAALFPSVTVEWFVDTPMQPKMSKAMVDQAVTSILLGAREFWVWGPRFNLTDGDSVREAQTAFCVALNAAVQSLAGRRGYLNRTRQDPIGFLGANPP